MIPWRVLHGPLRLKDDEVHIWAGCLDVTPTTSVASVASLSEEERTRAKKFRFRQHQSRFIAGRSLLRVILSRYLNVEPARVEFKYNPRGKPVLAHPFESSGIHFNLSHSDAMALFAVTTVGPVGIDVERLRLDIDFGGLVTLFCSPREYELFQNLASWEKQHAFFNLWTRKEAFLKATGVGITQILNQVEVTFRPGEAARLIAVSGDPKKASRWKLHPLDPASNFAAAVAIEAQSVRFQYRKVDPNSFYVRAASKSEI